MLPLGKPAHASSKQSNPSRDRPEPVDTGASQPIRYQPNGLWRLRSPVGGATTLPPLGFNGELREKKTGWYILGNGYRAYNPVLGRFHSPDRLSPFDRGGLNPYTYCLGDPINYRDPTGHLAIFGLGASLLGRLATPAGALTAASIVSGVAAVAVMNKDPAIGTALLVISAASGLGAGYVSFGGRSANKLTRSNKKAAFSGTIGSARPDKPPPYDLLFPNGHPRARIDAKNAPSPHPHKTMEKLQGTTAKERKDYWPGATGQERRRQEILQHQQREQELRELEAELARVRALEAQHIRRHTRPPLQRQLGNMET